ncbi:MAG: Hsp20/alpha crystallin family protein [Thermaurantimonas sp.]|uniref:Hsp20/alpha crystallin family protein n=1 Tax=Thermaurantimonas sp. TaxID=2681568 RepID=UPI00391A13D1
MSTLMKRPAMGFGMIPSILDEIFNDDFFRIPVAFPKAPAYPAVNIKESDTDYKVEMAVPGLKKEDIKVNLEKGVLTISFEKKEEHEEKDKYTRREFVYQSFSRSFTIPEDEIDVEKIRGDYKDGILNITLPKKAKAEVSTSRMIEIK